MDDTEIRKACETFRLRFLMGNMPDIIARATKKRWGAREIIEDILRGEVEEAKRCGLESRMQNACLGTFKPIADFDWAWPKKIDRDAIESLFSMEFLKEPANVIFVGAAGVGKTMIAKNILHEAVMKGNACLAVDASKMLSDLGAQPNEPALERRLKKYTRPRLLLVDEVGYLSYSTRAADLLFQVISRRYETSSTIVTTNSPFRDWGDIFPSAGCVSVMIDRLTHRAEILPIEADSYRMKEASDRHARGKKTPPKKGR